MSSSRRGGAFLAAMLAALSGCGSSQPVAGAGRVLITHTENLSGDAALDGTARVVSHLVRSQLAGSKSLAVFEAADPSEALQRRAGRIVRSWLDAAGGKLMLHVTVRSAEGKTLEQWESAVPAIEGSAVLAAAVVKHLAPAAPVGPAVPSEAASLFGQALVASAADAIPLLQKVVAQSPAWGDAYYLLGANLAATGKTDEALRVWKAGTSRATDEVSKARMAIGIAAAMKEPAAAVEANEKLAALLPSEPEIAMQAGELRLARNELPQAAALMKRAVEAQPGAGEWWNTLAFVQAFTGDEKAAMESIRRYEQLSPQAANPPDSRGEIQFLMGQFRQASASFEEAFRKEPSFLAGATLLKSADALLMAGDTAGADKEFQRYLTGTLKGHPLRELILARWEFQTGKKVEAFRRTTAFASAAGTAPDLAAAGWIEIAWWQLRAGDRTKALEAAKTALQKAQSPAAKREALLPFYLAQPSGTLEDWKRRANGNPPADILALALVFDHKWKDAVPVLAELVAKTHPFRAGHWRVLYAWALTETGQAEKAREWLRWYPIPLSSGGDMIEPLVMEKVVKLRKR
ncbi:MAG: tetratricopeptide repeat protein [Acidobacteriota bacterium]